MISVRVFHDGVVLREQVFPRAPVVIGRGPECDVVLFDPSVSRAHARVEPDADGRLVLRDLGSRNGVRMGTARVAEVVGAPGIRCSVGTVLVEVTALSADDTLEIRAEDVDDLEQRRTVADHVKYVLLGVAAWIGMLVMDGDFWSPWQPNRSVTLLQHSLGAAVGVPVAAFILLGVLKAVGRPVRIADTLRAITVVIGVSLALDALTLVAYYSTPSPLFAYLGDFVAAAMIVFLFTYLASVRRKSSRRFRVLWAAAVGALVLALAATTSLAGRRTGTPAVDHVVQMPIAGVVGPSRTIERYLARVESAAGEAAAAAADVRARQGDD